VLTIPTREFNLSVSKHNVRLDILSDWIEASVLCMDESLSVIDIADVLIEEERYRSEDMAREAVRNAWAELGRRLLWIGDGCVFSLDNRRIRRRSQWQDTPAYAFCILLSMAPYYDWWVHEFGHDYTEQGELFELVTQASLEAQFTDWTVYQTGWTRSNAVGLERVVKEVAGRLGEQKGHLELWNEPNAKELGLDLLCYRPFPDSRVGIPVYLAQCASGANWKSKLSAPNLGVWRNVIQFTTMPTRALAAPFALSDREFIHASAAVDGLLLDRCRLLGASQCDASWLSQELRDRLVAWIEPRTEVLLQRSM